MKDFSDYGEILSVYGSHDAAVTFIDSTGRLKTLEYERFTGQRYAAFTSSLENRPGLGTSNSQREQFLCYVKARVAKKITKILFNELNPADKKLLLQHFPGAEFKRVDHHKAHAACGFYQSKFKKSLILSIDGGGNDRDGITTTKAFMAENSSISTVKKYSINLGVAYAAIGGPISEISPGPDCSQHSLVYAGKVMGLCAYGNVKQEWLDSMRLFYNQQLSLEKLGRALGLNLSFNALKGQSSYDLAATSQHVFEEKVFEIIKSLEEDIGLSNIILVGGCALNVLFNQKLAEYLETKKLKLYVPPNPNDCGLSLGQFLLETSHKTSALTYSGFSLLDQDKLPDYVEKRGAKKISVPDIITLLKKGKIIGLASGESEIGPRALGNRSIICDPSFPNMKDTLNSKVKFREWFRPFAPVAKLENACKYFEGAFESEYMSFAPTVKPKYQKNLQSITHVDNTSRLQTVKKSQHKLFYEILDELENNGHIPVILNTSFNIKGKPILTRIEDALHVLDSTELDYVVIEGFLFGGSNA